MDDNRGAPARSVGGPNRSAASTWFLRLNGIFIIITSLAIGALGLLILSLIAEDLRKSADLRADFDPFAAWLVDHRALWPLTAIPPLAIGFLLSLRSAAMGRAARWTLLVVGYAMLLPLFGLLLWSLIMMLTPLYTYKPL